MSTDSVPKAAPLPRRDLWLKIAVAVADGLPEPVGLRTQSGRPGDSDIIVMDCDTESAAIEWAAWATQLERYDFSSAGRTYLDFWGDFHGWHLRIVAPADVPAAPDPDAATILRRALTEPTPAAPDAVA